MVINRSILLSFFILLAVATTGRSEGMERYSWTLGYKPDKSIAFFKPAEGNPLKLDLFLPEDHKNTDKRPCIVFFFGGGRRLLLARSNTPKESVPF